MVLWSSSGVETTESKSQSRVTSRARRGVGSSRHIQPEGNLFYHDGNPFGKKGFPRDCEDRGKGVGGAEKVGSRGGREELAGR